jgi:hypothetical protein
MHAAGVHRVVLERENLEVHARKSVLHRVDPGLFSWAILSLRMDSPVALLRLFDAARRPNLKPARQLASQRIWLPASAFARSGSARLAVALAEAVSRKAV